MPDSPRAPKSERDLPESGPVRGDDPETGLESSIARNIMNERDPDDVDRPQGDGALDGATSLDGATKASTQSGAPADGDEDTATLLKDLTLGSVVDGKYKIDEILGRGAMGVVVAATHVQLRERTALKFLSTRRGHAQADDFRSRFRREAQVSAKLRNEHITRVLDVGMWRDKVPYMVMDYLVGNDLRRTLKSAPGGRLPIPVALDYVVQVCEGLAEAHAYGIVHRDLKPSNLFVTKRHDGTDLIKILDFGISKWSTQEEQLDELTQTGVVLGSPKYMSPEQLFGSAQVDPRADVWSIGAIFYEMLSGKPPFDFPTLTRICAELAADRPPPSLVGSVPDVTPELEAALLQSFVRDRDHRVPDVAELAGSLLDAVGVPFAAAVRAKIGSILDPKSQSSALTSSSASGGLQFGTGDYRSLSLSGSYPGSSPGSSPGARVSRPPSLISSGPVPIQSPGSAPPASTATAGGVEALTPSQRPEASNRMTLIVAVLVALLLGAGAVYFLFTPRGPRADQGPPPAASSGLGAVAPPAAQTAPPPPAAPVAAPATAPVAPTTAEPPSAATAAAPRGAGGHVVVHKGGGAPPKAAAPSPPPATAAAPPTAPPPPAPTPAPAPTPKVNPLEDRQ